ncbi:AraC family transcriptional regulator [Burkholderia metallica]|uniref:AraC family transcriptional regulator n=1 Tax=Burkholderia metallica TaxID=488729 RepID=UPI001576F716|nr:AraC family transcriptional regulator [Burkholderia metallica]NTZ04962.1 AraC family transcriptional regulator [Burkholderia metallica]
MAANNDPFSSMLRDTGFARRLLDLSDLAHSRALRFPCQRSMGLHLVLRGPVFLHTSEMQEPLCLGSGDVAVLGRGHDHLLSTQPTLEGLQIDQIRLSSGGVLDASATVLSGVYQFWHAPLHPFFAEMPALTVLRATELPRLDPLALVSSLLADELRSSDAPGASIAMQGLLDVVFTYALRHVIAHCAQSQAGWSQAQRDPQIGRVLTLMHEETTHPWTLEELARRVGLSRTALAERFRETMGDTPLNHLRTLRMQRAVQLLTETDRPLDAVATAVGYRDAFSFSKVFKRSVGLSPKDFRQRDAAERQNIWRFKPED